ncbi:exodeoxyribonuclease VII small subunit [Atopococcus tabaci]|uniref:exodeoxyribonuclease VII small subunit n=1 Tax=Atopococcus tabaci TaxID=269774 RepID=UPI00041A6536|nr:exodeoxyribonuclease VII small subunit [Atopococcus tabaci]
MDENLKFEDALKELEEIVSKLEQGDVPLEEALTQFQRGVKLSAFCRKQLQEAETTLTKMVDENGNEVRFENELETEQN